MDLLVGFFDQLGAIIALIAAAVWIAVVFTWGVLWTIIGGLFWLTLATIALFALLAIFRPQLLKSRESAANIDIDVIRNALRSGELDAEIARINVRNGSRVTS